MKDTARPRSRTFPKLAAFMFDVDGTLLLSDRSLGGYELLPGAADALGALTARGIPYVLLTNGSAYPPAEQAAKLRKHGLPVSDEQMITPSSVAAELMVRNGIARVLVLGSEGVGYALRESGIETRNASHAQSTEVDAVYVGWHPDCGMRDIEAAAMPSSPAPNSTWPRTCRSSPRGTGAASATAMPSWARSGA